MGLGGLSYPNESHLKKKKKSSQMVGSVGSHTILCDSTRSYIRSYHFCDPVTILNFLMRSYDFKIQIVILTIMLPSLLYVYNACPYQWNFLNVTLNDRIYIWLVLCLSEEILLLGPPSSTFPFATYSWDFKLNTFTTIYSSSNQSMS